MKTRIKHILNLFAGLSILLLIFCLNSASVKADNLPIISLDPPSQPSPNVNQEATFTINIENAVDLIGFETNLTYDDNILEYVSKTKGTLFSNDSVFFVVDATTPGILKQLAVLLTPDLPTVNGNGSIITVKFKVKIKQATRLILTRVSIATKAPNQTNPDQKEITGDQLKPNANLTNQGQVTADLESSSPTGIAPLTVNFIDKSTGGPTIWNWSFGDNTADSVIQNPIHTYQNPGTYTVILTADNDISDPSNKIKENYITVLKPIGKLTLTANPVTLYTLTNLTSQLTIKVYQDADETTPMDLNNPNEIVLTKNPISGTTGTVDPNPTKMAGATGNYEAIYATPLNGQVAPGSVTITAIARGKQATVSITLINVPRITDIAISPADATTKTILLLPTEIKAFNLYLHANRDCPGDTQNDVTSYLNSLNMKGLIKDQNPDGVINSNYGSYITDPSFFNSGLDKTKFTVSSFNSHCQITVGPEYFKLTAGNITGTAKLSIVANDSSGNASFSDETYNISVTQANQLALVSLKIEGNKTEFKGDRSDGGAVLIVNTTNGADQPYVVTEPSNITFLFTQQNNNQSNGASSFIKIAADGEYYFKYLPTQNTGASILITARVENKQNSNKPTLTLVEVQTSSVNYIKIISNLTTIKANQTLNLTIETFNKKDDVNRKIVLTNTVDLALTPRFQTTAAGINALSAIKKLLNIQSLRAEGQITLSETHVLGVYQASYTVPQNVQNGALSFTATLAGVNNPPVIDSPTITVDNGNIFPPIGGEGTVGSVCSPDKACKVELGLECHISTKKCIPTEPNRKIGTWCSKVYHCKKNDSAMVLTCNSQENYCVGGVPNVSCLNDVVNKGPNAFGFIDATQLDSTERCDTGLYCDPNKGSCQNDFGQGKIPADKLGEAAEDIRDQIRNIINIALGFLGVAGVILVIYGGAIWLSAAGDDEKVGKAKKTIIAGMIGLVIIGVAWTIVSYVLTITRDIA